MPADDKTNNNHDGELNSMPVAQQIEDISSQYPWAAISDLKYHVLIKRNGRDQTSESHLAMKITITISPEVVVYTDLSIVWRIHVTV